MQEVSAECQACGGTGIYSGIAEPKGTAVVCLKCSGTGCQVIKYTPFTKRKPKSGIKKVMLSRGSFILSCGPTGTAITYKEFEQGKMPETPPRP